MAIVFRFGNLERCRQFYSTSPITNALGLQLGWGLYRTLICIDNEDKRGFYIAESSKNNWNARQLERQVNSQWFERILLNNNLQVVLAVAREEKLSDAKEVIIYLMVLEFLGSSIEVAPRKQ